MELMLAALVFLSAVVLLFAKELEALINKMVAIPGVKLTLPLLLVSFVIEQYDEWCVWFLLTCQEQLSRAIQMMIALSPVKLYANWVSEILLLFIIACIPIVFVWVLKKKSMIFRPIISPVYLGYVFWIVAVFLLTT